MPYRIELTDLPVSAFDQIVALGALDVDVVDGRLVAILPDEVTPAQVTGRLGQVPFAVHPAAGRDDDSVWVVRPRAVRVGSIRIVPAEAVADPGDLRLVDAPAFGTGLHPTTTLCLEAMEGEIRASRPVSVLDVGAGSGVLALAALALGVAHAVALDIDAGAVAATRANGALNGVSARLDVIQGSPETLRGTWPLVVANIQAAPLIEMTPTIARLVGRRGSLILAGIRVSLRDEVERAYRRVGMHRFDEQTRAGWTVLAFRASW